VIYHVLINRALNYQTDVTAETRDVNDPFIYNERTDNSYSITMLWT
jgi:hypothetical protein